MSELKFSRINNDKYNTVSINIEHAFLTLRDCEILKTEKTKWHYRKTVIQLNQPDLSSILIGYSGSAIFSPFSPIFPSSDHFSKHLKNLKHRYIIQLLHMI